MTCEETGKVCYTSAKRARIQTKFVGKRMRPYFCIHCHYWHTTRSTVAPSTDMPRDASLFFKFKNKKLSDFDESEDDL